MNQQTVTGYSSLSKSLHWLIAVLVIGLLSGSFFLKEVPKQYASTAYMLHKSIGLTVLFLMIIRIYWIAHCGRPLLPSSVPKWIQCLSRSVQYAFYGLLIVMPMSGWIMSVAANRVPSYFGLFPLPLPGVPVNSKLNELMNLSHKTIAWILIALVCMHIAGAIKHYFIDKDNVVQRMLW